MSTNINIIYQPFTNIFLNTSLNYVIIKSFQNHSKANLSIEGVYYIKSDYMIQGNDMDILYFITIILSLLLLVLYFFIDKKRNKWLLLIFISISICNIGYFFLASARNITFVIISNDIVYLGSVFLPFFMLMLILNNCNLKVPKPLIYSLIGISTIMLWVTTSIGYLPIYYKDISLELINDEYVIEKEYGPFHTVYIIYIFSYFISMIGTIIYATIKKTISSKMQAIFLSIVVLGNILVWLVERFIDNTSEFLSISYVINECLLLLLYGILYEYESNIDKKVIKDISSKDFNEGLNEEQIDIIFSSCQNLSILSTREKEILRHILLGEKRKEIGVSLFISESAVKKHTTNIFRKLNVNNRNELFTEVKKSLKSSL